MGSLLGPNFIKKMGPYSYAHRSLKVLATVLITMMTMTGLEKDESRKKSWYQSQKNLVQKMFLNQSKKKLVPKKDSESVSLIF